MGKHINSTKLTETLTLSECSDGFWLYDKTRGMNLSMRAKNDTGCLRRVHFLLPNATRRSGK